jgi:TonB family protein
MMAEISARMILAIAASSELSLLAKATIVAALALAVVQLAGRTRAAVRAVLLASLFGALLILPVAAMVMPSITVEIPTSNVLESMVQLSQTIDGALAGFAPAAIASGPSFARSQMVSSSRVRLLRVAWAGGVALFCLPMVAALWRVRRLRRGSLPWPEGQALVGALAAEAGLRRSVDLVMHDGVPAPMTYGFLRPVIVLPSAAAQWSVEHLRQSLVHEVEHICRADWPIHLAARVACAVYWFHPLVWTAWRRLRLESERACDDAVLRRGDRTAYADQLVALARRLSHGAAEPLLSMANRSDLSARISSLLDNGRPRGRAGLSATAAVVGVAAVIVLGVSPLRAVGRPSGLVGTLVGNLTLRSADAGVMQENVGMVSVAVGAGAQWVAPLISEVDRSSQAAADRDEQRRDSPQGARRLAASAQSAVSIGASGSFSGALLDTFGRALPDQPITLKGVSTDSRYQGRSDASGRFGFPAIDPGDYDLDAQVPGFTTRYRITVRAGQQLERDVTLQIGSIEETLMATRAAGQSAPTPPPVTDLPPYHAETSRCGQPTAAGCIDPPRHLRMVRPQYPSQRTDGSQVIHLEGRIGTDGFISALRVLAPADEDFASAALDAVREWRFAPARLDGVAVEVGMKVTVRFSVE